MAEVTSIKIKGAVDPLDVVGALWLASVIEAMVDGVEFYTPVDFCEKFRYLPGGTTSRPGPMRFDLFPHWREPLNCMDPRSPVREVNILKGVQIGYTVNGVESVIFFTSAFLKTISAMYLTADDELAKIRIENNIIPMFNESGFGDLIRSHDIGNKRKTGKTKLHLQWEGGGTLYFNGAQNAAKMRQTSVGVMVKDELDGWPRVIGKDGNSDELTNARLAAFWPIRKIFRGSTPLLLPSMIWEAFQQGDQRVYKFRCKACSYPQQVKMRKPDTENGVARGFLWETEAGVLVPESVRYCCTECGHAHFDHDKESIFAEENGAVWVPTAPPSMPDIRSYHMPAWLSPVGFYPWSQCIADYLKGWDPIKNEVVDLGKFQTFYNNILGKPFEPRGSKVPFRAASRHRRSEYSYGMVPNRYAEQYTGSKILFLTLQVDVHKRDLAVSVFGWTQGSRAFLVDYWRFERRDEDDDCRELSSPVWARLQDVIENKEYTADNGDKYGIAFNLIDAGSGNDTVVTFCNDYEWGVYPILGRDRPAKHQRIQEFGEWKTKLGTIGFRITVDHYKDRMSQVLRRRWEPEVAGYQPQFHFNAPIDITDKQLKELTVEFRAEETDPQGLVSYRWHRPGTQTPNELWDLFGYGYAAVDILAFMICMEHFDEERVDWEKFWAYVADPARDELFCRLA